MEVEVSTDPELQLGTPRLLVRSTGILSIWRKIAMTQDEGRFIGIRTAKDDDDEETPDAGIHVVENWTLDFED